MRRGEVLMGSSVNRLPSSDVNEESGRERTFTPLKPAYGRALVEGSLRELERLSYLSPLEMEYLSIYRRILPTMFWDLEGETSSWN